MTNLFKILFICHEMYSYSPVSDSSRFLTRSDTNEAVQPQEIASDLKFQIYVEGLYYLCSKNKGADQLRGYRAADLHLCFRICKVHDAAQIKWMTNLFQILFICHDMSEFGLEAPQCLPILLYIRQCRFPLQPRFYHSLQACKLSMESPKVLQHGNLCS